MEATAWAIMLEANQNRAKRYIDFDSVPNPLCQNSSRLRYVACAKAKSLFDVAHRARTVSLMPYIATSNNYYF